ncbi:hypothetical protein NDI44_26790 [Trichocoleus sp. DQ-A3]|uniref:hypothetical protein n=1 Tax=Cyanophyceae TaxID=3028117 RepID=UPI0016869710|nr:hypothetical protein [Coleofasciculus sp. FACHB-125]MBD1903488.1 hypothetical protein [Coleofasciculus sp. FACHB-125]
MSGSANLMPRIDQARTRLQSANNLLSEAQAIQKHPSSGLSSGSDYDREIVRGGRARYTPAEAAEYTTNGSNDEVMAPKDNLVSNIFNSPINPVIGLANLLGYNTSRRSPTEDNDFYRDYAQYMPGYNINGIPSGAWAQNGATNYVGHGTGPGNAWYNARNSLVSQQRSMIEANIAAGGSGQLSFSKVYQAHVNAYDTSGGGGNGFIDPAHFGIAVYGVPLLETVGINSGPFTGASIDLLNNPEDSVTEGWAKRMGLAGVETTAGFAMMATRNPFGIVAGQATIGLGMFGAVSNTRSAVERGMLGDWKDTIVGLDPFD